MAGRADANTPQIGRSAVSGAGHQASPSPLSRPAWRARASGAVAMRTAEARRCPRALDDRSHAVITHAVGVPTRPRGQMLHAVPASVTDVFGEGPAVLARQVRQQPRTNAAARRRVLTRGKGCTLSMPVGLPGPAASAGSEVGGGCRCGSLHQHPPSGGTAPRCDATIRTLRRERLSALIHEYGQVGDVTGFSTPTRSARPASKHDGVLPVRVDPPVLDGHPVTGQLAVEPVAVELRGEPHVDRLAAPDHEFELEAT